jgi:hypothetical protein
MNKNQQTTVQTTFLDTANKNQLHNYVMTELSKEYNIQPQISAISQKFIQIMNYIAEKIPLDQTKSFQQNLEYLNRTTIEKSLQGFRSMLESYAHQQAPQKTQQIQPVVQQSQEQEQDMPDVNDMYSKLLTERDYSSIQPSNKIANQSSYITDLSPIQEESSRMSEFHRRMDNLRQNRNVFQEERNQLDLQTRENNHRVSVLGQPSKNTNASNQTQLQNYANTLENSNVSYDDKFAVSNVGREIVSKDEIQSHRYDEYKGATEMKYRHIQCQVFLNSKDRRWFGDVVNNVVQPGLEMARYRFQLNNSTTQGVHLQNRHKNITTIRVVSIYISLNELILSNIPPYIFIYIPELENRLETSLPNRKFVFTILTKDDVIGNQLKYVNFLATNNYEMNPLAELNNLTFEILNPMGYLYNQTNDDLNVVSVKLNDVSNPEYIVITTNHTFLSKQYIMGDVLILKNFTFTNNPTTDLTYFANFMNREQGHHIMTPITITQSAQYSNQIYLGLPRNADNTIDSIIDGLKSFPDGITDVVGVLLNITLQPSIVMEITKIEPDSSNINVGKVQVI